MDYVDFDATTGRWIGHFLERLQKGERVINPEEAAILNILRVIVDRKLSIVIEVVERKPRAKHKCEHGTGGCPA